jgi:hypothetical protein
MPTKGRMTSELNMVHAPSALNRGGRSRGGRTTTNHGLRDERPRPVGVFVFLERETRSHASDMV